MVSGVLRLGISAGVRRCSIKVIVAGLSKPQQLFRSEIVPISVCFSTFSSTLSKKQDINSEVLQSVLESTILKTTKSNNEKGLKLNLNLKVRPVESILVRVVVGNNITPNRAVTLLSELSKLTLSNQAKFEDFSNDHRFKVLCNTLGNNCNQLTHLGLITGLRSVLVLGFSPDSFIVQSLENEILWKARKMNLKALSICLHFHINFQESDLQKKVVKTLVQTIQKRYFEISDGTDVLKLLEQASNFSEDFMTKIEDRALELAGNLSIEELNKLLCLLAELNRRPTPLLRALVFHMNQSQEKLSLKQMINTLYALNKLNFPDSSCLQKISSEVLVEVVNLDKVSVISALLTSLGHLRWKHPALLEACGERLLKYSDKCRPQEWVAYLLTLAKVNYIPENPGPIFSLISSELVQKNIPDSAVWLDIVWSLAILGRATESHLRSVLSPSFYQPLIGMGTFRSYSSKMKLLNLNAVATLEITTCPPIINEPALEDISPPATPDTKSVNKSVLEALNNFVPRGKFMATNLSTTMGCIIDAEFIVNKDGKPQPIVDYGVQAGFNSDTKPVPADCYRIALLVWDFKDLTMHSQDVIGVNALNIRLLTKLGYTVVQVLHSEFNLLTTTVKKVQYLQQKIAEVLHNKDSTVF
ncbi:protein TBRG4-like [Limulus polyphemus]|uniref:Protein TBRG4-like n=1 Tax=Limulus polyphemus TaxID=6850 RepID=A0ABM1C2E7_LIMPO|nr:protein TBRG4-like [Limulus polyphemus]